MYVVSPSQSLVTIHNTTWRRESKATIKIFTTLKISSIVSYVYNCIVGSILTIFPQVIGAGRKKRKAVINLRLPNVMLVFFLQGVK
jgi:hypothetical protein